MGDMLKTGLEWLASKRTACMASTITYRRGLASKSISATVGRPDKEAVDEMNIRVSSTTIDFLFLNSDFATTFTKPERGDVIEYEGRTYEVMDFAGQGHWRWSGRPGITIRVHTKQVS